MMKPGDKDKADIGENRGLRVSCGATGVKSFFYRYTSPVTGKLAQVILPACVQAHSEGVSAPSPMQELPASAEKIESIISKDSKRSVKHSGSFSWALSFEGKVRDPGDTTVRLLKHVVGSA